MPSETSRENNNVGPVGDVELGEKFEDKPFKDLNLYEEAHDMMEVAFIMFALPDIRAMAKEGLLKGDEDMIRRVVELPATAWDILTVYEDNFDEINAKERLGASEERAEMYRETLQFHTNEDEREDKLKDITLQVFDDLNVENECLYMVAVNKHKKRVTVSFRGTVTRQDLRKDLKAVMTSIDNPVLHMVDDEDKDLPEKLGVHMGFREYLYGDVKFKDVAFLPNVPGDRGGHSDVSQTMKKYQIILKQAKDVLDVHPGYHLYIAGHSLGGALATLLALEAGASQDIVPNEPVTCITTGSPKVGNLDFIRAMQVLELKGKLRMLRVMNDKDAVPLVPPFGDMNPCFAVCCQHRRYRHSGLVVKLYRRKGRFHLGYPIASRNYCGILCCDMAKVGRNWAKIFMFAPICVLFFEACLLLAIPTAALWCTGVLKKSREKHTQLDYMRRLEQNKDMLEKLSIDGLNAQRFERERWKIPLLPH